MTEALSDNVEFRRLKPRDLPLVLKMNEDFREGFAKKEEALRFLNDPKNLFFAALRGGSIVGFSYGYALNRLAGGDMLYVHEVGVAASMRRRGIGAKMLTELFEALREEGFSKAFLSTHQNNIAANALYRKTGGTVSADSDGRDVCYTFALKQ